MKKIKQINKTYLLSVVALTSIGFFIFTSASLGLLAKSSDRFVSVFINQIIALVIGIVAFYFMSRLDYHKLKKWALGILVSAIAINCLLFIPQISLTHGGATRWIDIGFTTIQPSEFLKLAFVIYFSAWIVYVREEIKTFLKGPFAYLMIMFFLGLLLLLQSDTDTLIVIAMTGIVLLFVGGGKKRHIGYIMIAGAILLSILVMTRPYIKQRVMTYLNPSADIQGSGYQINQSLMAIGSGEWNGRGFGQSRQKFSYLPEPVGDSIFAVWAEEFGFIGGLVLIGLYVFFISSVFKIASLAEDSFGRLLAVGIGILVVIQSFMNMSSMAGLIPLSGMPLLFVSQGGTALIVILAASGVVANISRGINPKQ